MASKLDLTHTLRADHIVHDEARTLEELQARRMVRTNDSRGVSYSFGNRAMRRMVGRGDGKHRGKQVHKQGH